jgi:hypothetical protein
VAGPADLIGNLAPTSNLGGVLRPLSSALSYSYSRRRLHGPGLERLTSLSKAMMNGEATPTATQETLEALRPAARKAQFMLGIERRDRPARRLR